MQIKFQFCCTWGRETSNILMMALYIYNSKQRAAFYSNTSPIILLNCRNTLLMTCVSTIDIWKPKQWYVPLDGSAALLSGSELLQNTFAPWSKRSHVINVINLFSVIMFYSIVSLRFYMLLTIPYIVCVYCPSGTLEAAIVLPLVLLLRQRKYGH